MIWKGSNEGPMELRKGKKVAFPKYFMFHGNDQALIHSPHRDSAFITEVVLPPNFLSQG